MVLSCASPHPNSGEPGPTGERRGAGRRAADREGPAEAQAFVETVTPHLAPAQTARSLARVLTSLAQEERRQGQARVLFVAAAQAEHLERALAGRDAERAAAARYRWLREQAALGRLVLPDEGEIDAALAARPDPAP